MHPAGHIGKIRRMTVGGQPYLLGSGTACACGSAGAFGRTPGLGGIILWG